MPTWVETRRWPRIEGSPFDALPPGIECRSDGTTSVLGIAGTDKVVGFVTARFDPNNLNSLVERLLNM